MLERCSANLTIKRDAAGNPEATLVVQYPGAAPMRFHAIVRRPMAQAVASTRTSAPRIAGKKFSDAEVKAYAAQHDAKWRWFFSKGGTPEIKAKVAKMTPVQLARMVLDSTTFDARRWVDLAYKRRGGGSLGFLGSPDAIVKWFAAAADAVLPGSGAAIRAVKKGGDALKKAQRSGKASDALGGLASAADTLAADSAKARVLTNAVRTLQTPAAIVALGAKVGSSVVKANTAKLAELAKLARAKVAEAQGRERFARASAKSARAALLKHNPKLTAEDLDKRLKEFLYITVS